MVESPKLEIQEPNGAIATVDLTATCSDVWERVRKGFAMPELNNDLVTSQQVWYLNRPDHIKGLVERSRRYLFYIVEEIEKRGLPTELALLPMVESALNPMAYSPARASGLWQFIPSTGRSYGLEQNWWLDERRDIVASTGAALDYLQAIYEMHGDWHLALASYNWGENAVARAIARNEAAGLPTDYMSLSMPAETRNYVPKLQALKNIFAQPQLFGIALDPIPNRPYFATVKKAGDMDIAVAARLAETPVEEFRALNPSHNRPIIRSRGETELIVPVDKVDRFLSNLEQHHRPFVSWHTYTLGKREKLERVAARFGVSAARLREVNGLAWNARVPDGRTLLVPADNAAVPAAATYAAAALDTMPARPYAAAYVVTGRNTRLARSDVHMRQKGGQHRQVVSHGGSRQIAVGKKVATYGNRGADRPATQRVSARIATPVKNGRVAAKQRART
jgi:membrane-bound lytic murein transglycosylase D